MQNWTGLTEVGEAMLQGNDPFDTYRSKRKVEQLETDFRDAAERKRERMRHLLGREENDEEKVRRRVEAEMEDFFQAPEDAEDAEDAEIVDAAAEDDAVTTLAEPSSEIRDQIDAALGSDDDEWEEVDDGDAEAPDELQNALNRLRRGPDAEEEPPPAPRRRQKRPSEPVPIEHSVHSLDDLDPPDWLDLTEERIGEIQPPPEPEDSRSTDDFEFGGAVHAGPITRARPGVIDPFATPQSTPHLAQEPVAPPVARRRRKPTPAPAEPDPSETAASETATAAVAVSTPEVSPPAASAPAPASRPSMAEIAAEARMSELERRVAKLESMLERHIRAQEASTADPAGS